MYPKAYIDYLVFFHGPRDYFECHEVLEEYWKQDGNQIRNSFWVGLIQVAVALYHQRNGNMNGAQRTLTKAISILNRNINILNEYGINKQFINKLEKRLYEIKSHTAYYSFNIPIDDQVLLNTCQKICEELGYKWGSASDLYNESLVHKHRLRDRTEIIKEREKQKKLREEKQ
ncbi:DUF309 domain-containing protein [Bacillus sp. Marseille-P3661]|uniref:DUF309 domain-containing protein n=1 Tax=Bacillus sp. Marseille-P3661 TaxID=1936234 RepID=UPI000C852251|nr:DUF309 domain-containing protein [Bacillus sp. Marseille-P3661]